MSEVSSVSSSSSSSTLEGREGHNKLVFSRKANESGVMTRLSHDISSRLARVLPSHSHDDRDDVNSSGANAAGRGGADIEMQEPGESTPLLLPLIPPQQLQQSSLLTRQAPVLPPSQTIQKQQQPLPPHELHHTALLVRHESEILSPHSDCHSRKSTILIAMINLVATICGGGVLSLPLAFRRAGILPTTFLMVYAVVSTDFTLYLLVACARRTGGRTYGDVAMAAFGSCAQFVTTCTLAFMLFGTLVAYQVLVRDIWGGVLFDGIFGRPTNMSFRTAGNMLLSGILVASLPLALKKDLHALRHTCYVGFSSCVLLMMAVVYRAFEKIMMVGETTTSSEDSSSSSDINDDNHASMAQEVPQQQQQQSVLSTINWYSTDPADLIFAFPIVVLCFFCSYNVLAVHSQLYKPTRKRLRAVLDGSMLLCFVLFYAVGLCGYIYAGNDTADNILLNFPISDRAIMAGRMGYCFTLLFGLPLVVLPCREALLGIPQQFAEWRRDAAMVKKFRQISTKRQAGAHLIINGVDFDEPEPAWISEEPELRHGAMLKYDGTVALSRDETETTTQQHDVAGSGGGGAGTSPATTVMIEELLPLSVDGGGDTDEGSSLRTCEEEEDPKAKRKEMLLHVISTLVLLGITYIVAIIVPGVAAVWSIFGSSMAIWIAFIVPTICYLKIREHKGLTIRAWSGWFLLVVSCVSAVVCTRNAVLDAFHE